MTATTTKTTTTKDDDKSSRVKKRKEVAKRRVEQDDDNDDMTIVLHTVKGKQGKKQVKEADEGERRSERQVHVASRRIAIVALSSLGFARPGS